jgi:uncharacterized protein YndB with AHSA1/START domain
VTKPPTRKTNSSPLPTTIWLPDPHDLQTPPLAPAVLPDWALDKIRTEFTHRPGQPPAPLWRLAVGDTALGMDARTPCTIELTPAASAGAKPVVLAELHPDTLPVTEAHSAYGPQEQGAVDDAWPGFFHRVHRLLRGSGILLLAARQRREATGLIDPLGLLIAAARTAGFRYLQHIVVVHGHPVDDRIVPAPPDGALPGLIHSDLLILDCQEDRS